MYKFRYCYLFRYSSIVACICAYPFILNAYSYEGDVSDIVFTDVSIKGATFSEDCNVTDEMLRDTTDWKSGILDSIAFNNKIDNWNFSGMTLQNTWLLNVFNTDFSNTHLIDSNFGGNISNTKFIAARLERTSFYGDLSSVDFSNSHLKDFMFYSRISDANFTGAKLEGITFGNKLSNVNFTNADVNGSYFGLSSEITQDMLSRSINWQNGALERVGIESVNGWNFSRMTLKQMTFFDVSNTDFSNAHLIDFHFSCKCSNVKFTGARLENITFDGELSEVDFNGANIKGSSFGDCFTNGMLAQTENWQSGILENITFLKGVDGWSFSGKTLKDVNFSNKLINSDMTNVRFEFEDTNKSFSLTNSTGNDFSGAVFTTGITGGRRGMYVDNSIFNGALFYGDTAAKFADISNSYFDGAGFYSNKSSGATFGSIEYSSFRNAEFISNGNYIDSSNGAEFGAVKYSDFTGALFQGGEDRYSVKAISISDSNFSGARFVGRAYIDKIENSDFSNTSFSNGGFLEYVNNADFTNADLSKMYFYDILGNTKFDNARIDKCTFEKIGVEGGFTKEMLYSTSNYKSHDLSSVDLTGGSENNNLSGWDFSNQKMHKLRIWNDTNVNLEGTKFLKDQYTDEYNYIDLNNASNINLRHSQTEGNIFIYGSSTNIDMSNAKVYFYDKTSNYYSPTVSFSGNLSNIKLDGATIEYESDENISGVISERAAVRFGSTNYDYAVANNISFEGTQINVRTGATSTSAVSFASHNGLKDVSFNNAKINVYSNHTIRSGYRWIDISGISFHSSWDKNLGFEDIGIKNTLIQVSASNSLGNDEYLYGTSGIAGIRFNGANCKNIEISNVICDTSSTVLYETMRTAGIYVVNANMQKLTIKDSVFNATGNIAQNDILCTWVSGMTFTDSSLKDASFTNVSSQGIVFDDANIESATFKDVTSTKGKYSVDDMFNQRFDSMSSELGAVFYNTVLKDVSFENVYFEGADFTRAVLKSVYFTNSSFIGGFKHAYEKAHDDRWMIYNNAGAIFTDARLTDVTFKNVQFSNVDFTGAEMDNVNFIACDLRGIVNGTITTGYSTKNTIMGNGIIRGFSMKSVDDSFSIMAVRGNGAALAKSAENNLLGEVYNGISAKISEGDADISGGAVLSVKDGALLEVLDSRTLTLSQDGVLLFEIGDSFTGPMLFVDEGSSFVLDGGSIFVDLILDSVLEESGYSFDILRSFGNFDATSLAKGENVFLLLNGQAFSGEWGYEYSDGVLSINLSSIPEPSVYAAFLGVLSLGAAICRRRS